VAVIVGSVVVATHPARRRPNPAGPGAL